MSRQRDVCSTSAPMPLARGARGLVRWVCTRNPFYAISALLVCLGLWVSFGEQVRVEQTWALMLGLAGYTLLMAATACLLVRFVGVWDDVRTVMLLVVLMLLATSVALDAVPARGPALGIACYLAGLLFAVLVSEGMLRGARLRLPAGFRAPYYLAMALFFLYPPALSPLVDHPRSEALAWALFGFSTAAGLVALTLLPAVRRGRAYVRGNGSPWPWPLYPWALFVFLGLGVVGRAYLLCWSMHHLGYEDGDRVIFGPYFLVPFGLAVAVLLLELGLVERGRGTLRAALAVPAGLIVLSAVGHHPDSLYRGFLDLFSARLGGTPLYLTLLAASGFYVYAALRRVPMAVEALTAALAALTVLGPDSLRLDQLVSPRALPLLAAAALQLGFGLLRQQSGRVLIGAGMLMGAAFLGLSGAGPATPRGPIAFHLALAAVLAVGAAFDDALGRLLRGLGASLALLACLVVSFGARSGGGGALPTWLPVLYPPALAILIGGYGLWLRHRVSIGAAVLGLSGWLAAFGWWGYRGLREHVPGLDYIALGLVSFALAALISAIKGGALPRRVAWGKGKIPELPG